MAAYGLAPGQAILRDSARAFFERHHGKPTMYVEKEMHRNLEWTPALRFVLHGHINVFVEADYVCREGNAPQPRVDARA